MQEEKKKTIHKQQIIKEKRTGNNRKEQIQPAEREDKATGLLS